MQQTTQLELQIIEAAREWGASSDALEKLSKGLQELKLETCRDILSIIQEWEKENPEYPTGAESPLEKLKQNIQRPYNF